MPLKTEYIIELLITFIIGYLTYLVFLPFLIPIFWGVVLVILFYPYYLRVLRKVNNRTAASLIACFTVALFLIVPMAVAATAMVNEMIVLYQWAENYLMEIQSQAHGSPVYIFPYLQKYLGRYVDLKAVDISNIAAIVIKEGSSYLTQGLKGAIKNFAEFFFNLILAFFTMYFLFKDGEGVLDVIKDILPISDEDKEKVFSKNRVVISATFYGGVFVGAVQGLLGGIAFWFLGLSAPMLWGFMMFILSFLPGFGTALVWFPASIYLLVVGSYWKAAILFLWGAFVVGLVDNFIRPAIVSGKTNQHPLLIFFSILGAINVFGLIGIVAGPIIVCVAQAALDIYRETIKEKKGMEAS